MKNGTALAVMIILGYVAFEGYAVHKASYRTEPAYIYNMLIEAQTAVDSCDDGLKPDVAGFRKVLTRVTLKYKNELAEQQPTRDDGAIDQAVSAKAAAARNAVNAYIAENGCADQEVRNHQRRFDIYARKG